MRPPRHLSPLAVGARDPRAHYRLFQLAGTAHRVSPLVEVTRPRADNVFAIPRRLVDDLPWALFEPRRLR